MALFEPLQLAQIEPIGIIQNQKLAQIKPKRLALTDRNQWHKSNRNIQAELKNATREVNKLSIELENAKVRLGMETKEIKKQWDQIHRLQKRNIDLKDEIAALKFENDDLQQQITNQEEILDSQNKNKGNLSIGSIAFGVISLLVLPTIFKK